MIWERGKRVFLVILRSESSSTDIDVEAGIAWLLPLLHKEDEEGVEGPGVAWEDEEVWNLIKRSSVTIKSMDLSSGGSWWVDDRKRGQCDKCKQLMKRQGYMRNKKYRPIRCVKNYRDAAEPLISTTYPLDTKNRPSTDRHPYKKMDGDIQRLDWTD